MRSNNEMNLLKCIGRLAFTTTTITAQCAATVAMPQGACSCAGGTSRGKCPKLQTLWTQTDHGSEIVALLRTRIFGQDPWKDADWKFQDPHTSDWIPCARVGLLAVGLVCLWAYTAVATTAAVCCRCGLSYHNSESCGRTVPDDITAHALLIS